MYAHTYIILIWPQKFKKEYANSYIRHIIMQDFRIPTFPCGKLSNYIEENIITLEIYL